MDFQLQLATVDEFSARHPYFCTSPELGYVRTCCVMRRDATGIDVLRGCVLERVGIGGTQVTLQSASEWFAALADSFGLPLSDLDAPARALLWERVWQAHGAWWVGSRSAPEAQ